MNLPTRYYYGPSRPIIAGFILCFGAAATFLASRAVHCDQNYGFVGPIPLSATGTTIYYWVRVGLNVTLGSVFAGLTVMALINLFNRLTHPRMLELAADALLLPYGLLQKHTRRIAYADIQQVKERIFGGRRALYITTAERTCEISTFLLPGGQDYQSIKEFMFAHTPAPMTFPVKRVLANMPTRVEFLHHQSEAERQIRRQIVPFGINYAIMLTMVPAILALILFLAMLPITNYPADIRAELGVRGTWVLAFCACLYTGSLLANWDGKRRYARLGFKCPSCQQYLMFAPGKASLKTGQCVHCGDCVFY